MIVQDVSGIRQEVTTDKEDLRKWRHQISLDMQMFYEKYDARIQEAGLSDEDRQNIVESTKILNSNIMMNKQNIHNLASAIDKLEASIEATEKKRQ